jgi:hypothetical protein
MVQMCAYAQIGPHALHDLDSLLIKPVQHLQVMHECACIYGICIQIFVYTPHMHWTTWILCWSNWCITYRYIHVRACANKLCVYIPQMLSKHIQVYVCTLCLFVCTTRSRDTPSQHYPLTLEAMLRRMRDDCYKGDIAWLLQDARYGDLQAAYHQVITDTYYVCMCVCVHGDLQAAYHQAVTVTYSICA